MTSTHSLSPAEFDALAHGDADAKVIGKLLVGQVSKRIVMILAVLDLAAERCPGTSSALDTAYNLLAKAQSKDAAAAQSVLTHPSVGGWAAGCLRSLQISSKPADSIETDVRQLAAVAAAAAVRARHAFAVQIPLRDGTLMLPTLGLATFGPGCAAAVATVSFDGAHLRLDAGDQVVIVPADPAEDGAGWQGVRKLRSQAGQAAIVIDLDDVDPGRDGHGSELSHRADSAAFDAWQSALNDAWKILITQYPRRAAALAGVLRAVVPLRQQAGSDGVSSTARDAIGAIVMTPAGDPLRFADTLIHELHHSVLYALTDLIALHRAGPQAEYYSPWREDPRPIEGLLHGAYAYLGVVDFWCGQRGVLSGSDLLYADFEFARWRHQVAQAARTLLDSGFLTADGVTFVQGMAATAGRWLGVAIDCDVQQLADRARADHRIRWGLRNRRPHRSTVSAIADAWLAHSPCPVDPRTVPASIVQQPRILSPGKRVGLCHTRLQNPDDLDQSGASAADIAYISDDFVAAMQLYQTGIAREPADIESWAGLALTLGALNAGSGFSAAPEVAWAVYLDLAGRAAAPDIVALDRWLASAIAGVDAERTVHPARR